MNTLRASPGPPSGLQLQGMRRRLVNTPWTRTPPVQPHGWGAGPWGEILVELWLNPEEGTMSSSLDIDRPGLSPHMSGQRPTPHQGRRVAKGPQRVGEHMFASALRIRP